MLADAISVTGSMRRSAPRAISVDEGGIADPGRADGSRATSPSDLMRNSFVAGSLPVRFLATARSRHTSAPSISEVAIAILPQPSFSSSLSCSDSLVVDVISRYQLFDPSKQPFLRLRHLVISPLIRSLRTMLQSEISPVLLFAKEDVCSAAGQLKLCVFVQRQAVWRTYAIKIAERPNSFPSSKNRDENLSAARQYNDAGW